MPEKFSFRPKQPDHENPDLQYNPKIHLDIINSDDTPKSLDLSEADQLSRKIKVVEEQILSIEKDILELQKDYPQLKISPWREERIAKKRNLIKYLELQKELAQADSKKSEFDKLSYPNEIPDFTDINLPDED